METQEKVIAKVYMTYDYGKFKKLAYNRELYALRLNKIKASLSAGEVLNPIVVNEKMEIIDGQGRFEAKKEMGLPIYYIISKGADIDDCRRMNSYSTNWNVSDYVDSWSTSNDSYQRIKAVHISTKMPYSRILRLAGHSDKLQRRDNPEGGSVIKSGNLHFSESDAETVKAIYKHITAIIEALGLSKKPNENLYNAMAVIWRFPGYEPEHMIDRCKVCKYKFISASGLEDQLKNFSDIYNYRTQVNKRLYFEDYMRNRGYHIRGYSNIGFANNKGDDLLTLANSKEE